MILIPGDPFGGTPRPRQFICQACGLPGTTTCRTPVHYHAAEACQQIARRIRTGREQRRKPAPEPVRR